MGEHRRSLRQLLRRGALALRDPEHQYLDQFGAVLVLTVLTISGLMLFELYRDDSSDGSIVAATVLSLVVGLTLMLALRAAGVGLRARRIANVFLLLASLFSIIAMVVVLTTDRELGEFNSTRPSVMWVLIALVAPVAVVRRLLQHRRVTVRTMLGAITAYLMIAIAYTYLFLWVGDVRADEFFTNGAEETSTAFAYFSLTTITTLGYGDLSPATNVGRLMATSEAIIGQVYLVTFVAMFVGLFIAQRTADDEAARRAGDGTEDQSAPDADT